MFPERLNNIIKLANLAGEILKAPVHLLNFKRTTNAIKEYNIDRGSIKVIDLLTNSEYLSKLYHSSILISDSGSAQEENLFTGVLCPRRYTERPLSMENSCSVMVDVDTENHTVWTKAINDALNLKFHTEWLRDGLLPGETTSGKIVEILKTL